MQYMGSKGRLSKELLPIILKQRTEGQCYVEPFVGGGNMIDKVTGERIGGDLNAAVINALECIRDRVDALPKDNTEFTEDDYRNRAANYQWMYGFASFAYSFGGKYWGGWSRNSKGDDYIARAFRSAKKQTKGLQGTTLVNKGYTDLDIPSQSLIYCDPPYASTTKYKDSFDSESFWNWCRSKAGEGHTILISEFNAPDDFISIWSKARSTSLTPTGDSSKINVEHLFVHESQVDGYISPTNTSYL